MEFRAGQHGGQGSDVADRDLPTVGQAGAQRAGSPQRARAGMLPENSRRKDSNRNECEDSIGPTGDESCQWLAEGPLCHDSTYSVSLFANRSLEVQYFQSYG